MDGKEADSLTCIRCGAPIPGPAVSDEGQAPRQCAACSEIENSQAQPHAASEPKTIEAQRADALSKAVKLAQQNRLREAADLLKTVDGEPEDPEVKYGIAYCLYKMQAFDEATPFADRAAEIGSEKAIELLRRIQAKRAAAAPSFPAATDETAKDAAPSGKTAGVNVPAGPGAGASSAGEHAIEAAKHLEKAMRQGFTEASKAARPFIQKASQAAAQKTVELREKLKQRAEAERHPSPQAPPAVEAATGGAVPVLSESGPINAWCVRTKSLQPRTLLEAHYGDPNTAAPVVLEVDSTGVRLRPRPIPPLQLSSLLVKTLFALLLIPMLLLWNCFALMTHVIFMMGSLFGAFTGNFLPLIGSMYQIGICAVAIPVQFVLLFVQLFRVVKITMAMFARTSYVYIPHGMKLQSDGTFASFNSSTPLQIMQLDLSEQALKSRSRSKKGCLKGLLYIFFLPLMLAIDIIRKKTAGRQDKSVSLLAMISGPPVDTTPASSKREIRKKLRQEHKNQKRREVWLITVDADSAGETALAVQAAMNQPVTMVDDDFAEACLPFEQS